MKKIAVLFAGLLAAASLVRAEEASADQEAPAPAPLSRFSLGAYLSYWNVEDLDEFDVSGALGGGVVGQFRLHDRLAFELRLSGFAAGDSEDVYIEGEGWYEYEATIVSMPMEAGLVAFLPLGESFRFYGGGGAGFYLFDSQFRVEQGPQSTLYDIEVDDEAGLYVLLGARAKLARNVALFVEGKYTWVETTIETSQTFLRDIGVEGVRQDLDFSGLALNAGAIFTF